MPTMVQPTMPISLAVTEGIWCEPLAQLLALQRVEEPEVGLHIAEAAISGLEECLLRGSHQIAITLDQGSIKPTIRGVDLLWQEEMVLALPPRSPLLEHPEVTIEMLRSFRVLPGWPCAHPALYADLHITTEDASSWGRACSFELLATLVAADYGVVIAPRSRVAPICGNEIELRPIAGGPYLLDTRLLRAPEHDTPAVQRFAERALRIGRSFQSSAAHCSLDQGARIGSSRST